MELDNHPAHSFGIRHSPHVGQLRPIPALTYSQHEVDEQTHINNLNQLKFKSEERTRGERTNTEVTTTVVKMPTESKETTTIVMPAESTVVNQHLQNGDAHNYSETRTTYRTEKIPSETITRVTKMAPQTQSTSSTTVTRVVEGSPQTKTIQNGSLTRFVETTKNGVTTRVVETIPQNGKTTRVVQSLPQTTITKSPSGQSSQVVRTQTTYTTHVQPTQTSRTTHSTKTHVQGQQTKVQATQKMICT